MRHSTIATSVAAVAVLLLGACGDRPAVDPGLASRLAGQAETLARHLEEGRPCDALDAADALVAHARAGQADGSVPEPIADEIVTTTVTIAEDVQCPQPSTDGPPEDRDREDEEEHDKEDEKEDEKDEKDEKDEDDRGNGRGQGRGQMQDKGGGDGP